MNTNKFKEGQEVAIILHDMIISAKIEKFTTEEKSNKEYAQVKLGEPVYGTVGVPLENIFETHKQALEEYKQRSASKIAEYESQMKTLDDMIVFAFTHVIVGDDCDWDAKKAYENRMKSFNIKIPEI